MKSLVIQHAYALLGIGVFPSGPITLYNTLPSTLLRRSGYGDQDGSGNDDDDVGDDEDVSRRDGGLGTRRGKMGIRNGFGLDEED